MLFEVYLWKGHASFTGLTQKNKLYVIFFSKARETFGCVNVVIGHEGVVVWLLFVSQNLTAAIPHMPCPSSASYFCWKAGSSDCLWVHGAAGSGCLVAHSHEWSTDVCVHALALFARSLKLGIRSWDLFLTFKKTHQPSGFGCWYK